ncbi:hypothetical protein BTO32_14740 [Marinobacter lutaoensis]|uniref:Uncharacterized protein n=1 Tax=Marinobacter lutaoensis TaxID=135739 RepID=A0A1V2DP77_9GAMM|nr:hypothetical protein [Marinobacter lutaoensis]ONF42468.1 hypothetical protein BTO32_14740 [Marinobacter lutaoensis]
MTGLTGTSDSGLTPQEKAVLNTYKEWIGDDTNTTIFLAGSTRGSIDLNKDEQRFTIRDDRSLSENFIAALKRFGADRVVDARVSAEQTLGLLNEMANQPFQPALQAAMTTAANDELSMDLDSREGASPGLS